MNIATPSIAGTGLFALDVVVRVDGTRATPRLGGSAGNVLSILGALGWSAAPVGVLGDDEAGHAVQRDFERVGADVRLLRRSPERSTPVIFQHQLGRRVAQEDATHRFTFACPTCGERRRAHCDNELNFAEVRAELPSVSVFYLDRPTRFGVSAAEQCASRGSIVVFEPSAVGDDIDLFERAARVAHIVKYSDERLGDLGEFQLRSDCIEVQTRGSHGLRFRCGTVDRSWHHLPAYRLPFIHDTSGAGDWCTAGMLYELFGAYADARHFDEEMIGRALAFGQALSTLNCMTEGARGLLAALSANRIIHAARTIAQGGAGWSALTDQAFRAFVHDVGVTPLTHTQCNTYFDCCTKL